MQQPQHFHGIPTNVLDTWVKIIKNCWRLVQYVGPLNFRCCSETKKTSWKMSRSFISMGKTTVLWRFNPHSRWVKMQKSSLHFFIQKSVSELLAVLSFMPFSQQRSSGKFMAREAGKKWGVYWSSHMEISRMSAIDLFVGDHPLAKWDVHPSGLPARKIWCSLRTHRGMGRTPTK